MPEFHLSFRVGQLSDAETIAALSVQVFLATYASDGVRPDLANEAFAEYSTRRFAERLTESARTCLLVEKGTGLLGFAEVRHEPSSAPVAGHSGSELVRLYVQPQAQMQGAGRALLAQSERLARTYGANALWLAAWEGNANALGFYAHLGYADVGRATYVIQGQSFGNRILLKHLGSP